MIEMEIEALPLTDSQKLDRLLCGFDNLQRQYHQIKEDHDLLREECRSLREDNKRLRDALLSLKDGSGESYLKCQDLIQEMVDLKENAATKQEELEQYKRMLEERNAQLNQAIESLNLERSKKACTCLLCKFIIWAGIKK